MRKMWTCLVSSVAACVTAPAASQSVSDAGAAGGSAIMANAPTSSLVSGQGIQFAASKDASSVEVKLVTANSALHALRADFVSLSFTLDAPIKKGESDHDLFSAQGIGDGTSFGISMLQFSASRGKMDGPKFESYCTEMQKNAAAQVGAEEASKLACTGENFVKYLPEHVEEARRSQGGIASGGLFWGASAKYGKQDFTYFDPQSLAKQSESTDNWSAGLFAGFIPTDETQFYMLTVARTKTAEGGTQSIRCPSGTGAPVDCANGAFVPPTIRHDTAYGLEARKMLVANSLAVSLSISRQVNSKKKVVELPFYFIPDGAKGLNAGVKASWNSTDKKTVYSAFVGASFNAWPFK